ncbi:uncharacterized protein M6B38_161315 [Iris pallida]|uniref:Uncharacterized protein n=1 Tax=Iris pallida TaxID=29817 RepID=A0AAX6EYG9_IRIPA|nr:uncharacterized protein M6B38_161315 [Iris pallida]
MPVIIVPSIMKALKFNRERTNVSSSSEQEVTIYGAEIGAQPASPRPWLQELLLFLHQYEWTVNPWPACCQWRVSCVCPLSFSLHLVARVKDLQITSFRQRKRLDSSWLMALV